MSTVGGRAEERMTAGCDGSGVRKLMRHIRRHFNLGHYKELKVSLCCRPGAGKKHTSELLGIF